MDTKHGITVTYTIPTDLSEMDPADLLDVAQTAAVDHANALGVNPHWEDDIADSVAVQPRTEIRSIREIRSEIHAHIRLHMEAHATCREDLELATTPEEFGRAADGATRALAAISALGSLLDALEA